MSFQKDQHPRLYFSREDLPRLREEARRGVRGEVLGQMRVWCERFLDPSDSWYFDFRERKRPIWKERESRMIWEPSIQILAFTYAFTGEKRYGMGAVAALLDAIETKLADVRYKSMGVEYEGWRRSAIHQHDKGQHAKAVSHVYDLCYDLLDASQRQIVREYIVESFHILDDPKLYANDAQFVTNNRGMTSFVGVRGVYLLAIEGDVEFPRIEEHIEEAIVAADAYQHSAFDQDGVCYEGGSYAGAILTVYAFAKMLARSGRGNLLRDPFWEKYLHYQLYELLPGGGRLNNLNDCEDRSGTVQPGLFLMGDEKGAIVPWLARQIDLHPSRKACDEKDWNDTINTLFGLMLPVWLWEWRDDATVRTPQELGFPPSHCFPQRGIASMRTGWGADDILLSHKCGLEPHGQHRQSDQNHIALYARGEKLLVDEGYGQPGIMSPSRYFSQADVHNLVIVDGKEPNPLLQWGGQAGGRIVDWLHTPDYDTSLGDATPAHLLQSAVNKSLRRVVFVRNTPHPFAIVIDEVVADASGNDHEYEALWRTAKENHIDVNGSRFLIAGATNGCHGQVLFPTTGADLAVKTHYNLPQLRVKVRAPRLEMVTAFVPIRRSEKPPILSCERHGQGDFAVTVNDDGRQWIIRAGTRREGPLHKPLAIEVRRMS